MEDDNSKTRLRKVANAKIIHAKFVLTLMAVFSLISIINLLTLVNDSFIPSKYFISPIISQFLFIFPAILCFKHPKTGFGIMVVLSALTLLRNLTLGDLLYSVVIVYVLISVILGYRAVNEIKEMNPPNQKRDDILDSGMF